MPETRRVALLADTHGFLDPRVAAIARDCGLVVHAGDIGCGAILDTLAANGARVVAVAGNNDTERHWPAADLAVMHSLPESATLDLPGGRLRIVHGHRLPARSRHRRLRADHPDVDVIVIGHSHRRVIDDDDLPWVLNPGAAGRTRAYGGPGCLVLCAAAAGWRLEPRAFDPLPRRRRG